MSQFPDYTNLNTGPVLTSSIALMGQSISGRKQVQFREQPGLQDQLPSRQELAGQGAANFVFRGEILESESYQKYYRPRFNQQIAPQNQSAIDSYQSTSKEDPKNRTLGLILDAYI